MVSEGPNDTTVVLDDKDSNYLRSLFCGQSATPILFRSSAILSDCQGLVKVDASASGTLRFRTPLIINFTAQMYVVKARFVTEGLESYLDERVAIIDR